MSKMEKGLEKLYTGDFNDMFQETLPDGSVIVILSKRGEKDSYRFRVKDLYGPNEQVLEHEVIEPDVKPWIKQRMDQAKKQRGGD